LRNQRQTGYFFKRELERELTPEEMEDIKAKIRKHFTDVFEAELNYK
jgi:lipoyl(octanoyl) transferase